MGKRGPAKTPTNLAVVRGERPDRLNKAEPQPSDGEITPPGWLSDEARTVWERLAPDLQAKGVLTPWDVDSFAILCDAVAHYRAASELVARSSVLIRGRKDAMVKNPAMQIIRDTAQTVRAYAQEFGLTPSARSGIQMPREDEHGSEDLLTG